MRLPTAIAVGAVVVTAAASGSAGVGSPAPLTWAPPALSNPVVITVTNANRRLYLDNSRDYRLNIVEHLNRELWIEGGRNVVVIGGHITIDQLGSSSSYQDNTAVKVRYGDPAGTVHLEGLLIDGAYVNDGIVTATGRNVQIQNVRVERAYDMIKNGHADCFQIQLGVGHLRVDRFTCSTQRQGFFLGDHDGPIGSADLRRVDLYGVARDAPALADESELPRRPVRRATRHRRRLHGVGAIRLLGLSAARRPHVRRADRSAEAGGGLAGRQALVVRGLADQRRDPEEPRGGRRVRPCGFGRD